MTKAKLSDLKQDRNNARKHNPRNIGMVANAIREVGVARSGVIDEDGNILAGNGTFEALAEAGIENIKIVKANGNEWVVVQREGLSDEQKVKLALYDNRSAELADWDVDVLKEIGPLILESVFTTDELADLLDDTAGGELEGEDSVPDAPEKAVTELGDLYQLGGHRLLCGDSTAQTAVDRLMDGQKANMVFTDPPYNVDYKSRGKDALLSKGIKNDAMGVKEFNEFLGKVMANYCDAMRENACIYVCHPDSASAPKLAFEESFARYFHKSSTIIWVKQSAGMGWQDYRSQHEPILYGWKQGDGKHGFYAGRDRTTVWEFNRDAHGDYVHPTQKPVALIDEGVRNSSKDGGVVLDLFGGSGSTLIACEKLNRKCYMMELDPQYCDVIVKRFNNLFPDREILRNGEAFQPVSDE